MNAFRYLPRAASPAIARGLETAPVVVVMGARQVGKSTLVRHHPALRDHLYVTLDDLDAADEARREPERLLTRAPRMILDEVQRVPELLHALKRMVDEGPRVPGRFVLTGSANLLLMSRVSESLAGRAVYASLWPMTGSELRGEGGTGRWGELFEVEVKNKFAVGDELELMTPAGNHRFALQSMEDFNGRAMDEAPGGGYRVRIPLPAEQAELGLLMKAL